MDAEIPPAIQQEKDHLKAWRHCEVVAAAPFSRLAGWLEHKGIDSIPLRNEKRRTIYKRLVKKGVWKDWQKVAGEIRGEWSLWKESGTQIGLCGDEKIFFSAGVKNEILWRLCEVLIANAAFEVTDKRSAVASRVVGNSEEGMDFLPPWMRWVALHPYLHEDQESIEDDPILKAKCDMCVEGCPNQAAMNWFLAIRGDKKAILEFFRQVGAKYSEEVKRTDKKPDAEVDPAEEAALEQVKSLEEMLGV